MVFFNACSDDYDSFDFVDGHYPASAESLKALSGNGRIQLKWEISDPGIAGAMIYWDNNADSVTFSMDTSSSERAITNMIDLPEGTYDFIVYNFYKNGLRSSPSKVTGTSLGASYKSSLKNREIISATFEVGGNAKVKWATSEDGLVGTNLNYWDQDKVNHTIGVNSSDNETVLENYNVDSSFTYQSIFDPGIDTFYTPVSIFSVDKFGFEEVMLDKAKFKSLFLPGDTKAGTTNLTEMENAWNGSWSTNINAPYGNYRNVLIVDRGSSFPMSMTFDMGQTAKLTRFRLNHYYPYIKYDMKQYEIWGTNHIDGSGDWNNWTKLITYDSPAGNADDFVKGDVGSFDTKNLPAVRYIRIKCLENRGGFDTSPGFSFAEITFWGYLQ